jgi:pyruvate dehydrogenase (quinone)
MNGINELITVARYWKRWGDPRLVVMVANNRDLNEMPGFVGVRVERPEDLGSAWQTVLSADRPAVLEVLTDPTISMLPPHITLEQAKAFGHAMLGGDPEEKPVFVQSIEGVLAGIFPTEKEKTER